MPGRILIALLVAAGPSAACTGQPARSPSRSTPPITSSVVSPSPSPSATSTAQADVDVSLPNGAPTAVAADVAAVQLAHQPPMPSGATLQSSWTGDGQSGTEAVAFAWRRGADPLAAENGFEVWVRFPGQDPAWRVVYAFTDRPSTGVFGIRFDQGDVTGDGVPDVLTFEDLGGSGACGKWRLVQIGAADATQTYAEQTCDTDIRIVGGDLEIRAAVYRPEDAHCCPSAYRITRLHWDGDAWKVTERATQPA